MRSPLKGLGLSLIVSAAIAGCANPGSVALHPVENQVPPLGSGVYGIKMVDAPPVQTSESRLHYPQELLVNGIGGKAVVLFTVRADGSVTDAAIVKADDIRFGEAAVEAIQKWRFRPAQVNGVPVDCRMTKPFFFSSPSVRNLPNPPPMNDPAGDNYSRIQPTEPR